MTDAVTIEQFLLARINPSDPLVPKRYDAMGFPVTDANPLGLITGIDLRVSRGKTTGDLVRDEVG
jgi:hypothetical protein